MNEDMIEYKILYNIFEEIDIINNTKNKLVKKYKYKKVVKRITYLVNSTFSSKIIKIILSFNNIIKSKGIVGYIPNKYGLHPRMNEVVFIIYDNDEIQSVEYYLNSNEFNIELSRFSFRVNDTNIKNSTLEMRWNKVNEFIKKILINTILDMGQFADLIVH